MTTQITNQDIELILLALQYFEANMASNKAKQDVISLKYRLLGYDDVPRHKEDLGEIVGKIMSVEEEK